MVWIKYSLIFMFVVELCAQNFGNIRFRVVDRHGSNVRMVTAELWKEDTKKIAYRAEMSSDQSFTIKSVQPGRYALRISISGLLEAVVGVNISDDREYDLGIIRGGYFDCFAPGMECFGTKPAQFNLACKEKFLPNPIPAEQQLDFYELERRCVHFETPVWPTNINKGFSVAVYVIIDREGKVSCATVREDLKNDAESQAAIAAALKCKFKPILINGVAVPIFGVIIYNK